ncbi:tetratricopeptide repeat protein [Sulfuricaulis sp.]|uniref:O-linked N-acetylglucosamine transferase, SPINDLY family protein n=1 Tax=Sulfuricaulis sp. TaxID=2003553 RepID=UPI00355961D8
MENNDSMTRSNKKQALLLLQSNKLAEAKSLLEKICKIDRNDIESWILLVQINARLGQPDQVEKCCREIIRINPGLYDAHYHLGCALMFQNKQNDAVSAFQRVIQLKPEHAMTYLHLGNLSASVGEALKYYQRAAQLEPNLAEAYGAVGTALVSCGQIQEAVASFREGLRIRPDFHTLHSSLLFALNYSAAYDAHTIFSEHVRWGQRYASTSAFLHANTPDSDRRLRVGYVSPDLREHSVSYFFEPLLANHHADEVETFCYAEVAKPDSTTKRLQSLAKHWYTTCGITDRELANRIHADRIDILVDLAGHSSNNRLLAFSAKPAPIQATYLGYPNTTGVAAIDYRLTDAWADPPEQTDSFHTEKLIRLPRGFLCYLPPSNPPPVTQPPVTIRGHVTYGSFNNLPKITPSVASLWASILRTVPDARLVLKNFSLSDLSIRKRYLQLFSEHGIAPDRLELQGRHDSMAEHLSSYGAIDIALDTFPYNGTTTTCEALLMGVPVVTLAGHLHAGRVGISLLTQLGLSHLIAETPEEYVRIASILAKNVEDLSRSRASLRERIMNSSLCDGKSFAREVESVYRSMWKKWCIAHKA